MITKQCPKCGQRLALTQFKQDTKTRLGVSSWCKACCNEFAKHRYRSDEEHRQQRCRRSDEWRKLNKDRARCTRLALREKDRVELADRYIAKLLTERGWPKKSITPDLLALKREQLQVLRLSGEVRDVLQEYVPPKDPQEPNPPTAEEIEQARLERNARFRARYAANVEKERARIAAYKAAHPEKVAAQRERAKQRKQQQNNATPAGAMAGTPQRETP